MGMITRQALAGLVTVLLGTAVQHTEIGPAALRCGGPAAHHW